jgi:hypothetical protein
MAIKTIITCDIKNCKSSIEVGDGPVDGAEELLEVTTANHDKFWFCCIEHLRQWANSYSCPYKKIDQKVSGESN